MDTAAVRDTMNVIGQTTTAVGLAAALAMIVTALIVLVRLERMVRAEINVLTEAVNRASGPCAMPSGASPRSGPSRESS